MSENVFGAENQQGSLRQLADDPSETTRRTPVTKYQIIAYLNGAIHDATLNKGKRIRFAQKNKQWLENLQNLLKQINCNSWIYKEASNDHKKFAKIINSYHPIKSKIFCERMKI